MARRKCVFTGKRATTKNKVIPKTYLSEDDNLHNWANNAPCSAEYESFKGTRMPNELEIQANEYFQLLELARIRVQFYEKKLSEVQEKLKQKLPEKPKMTRKKKKEIEVAIKLKEVLEEIDEHIDEVIKEDTKKVKDLWGD